MKKAILSLTIVLAMFSSITVHAAHVADSALQAKDDITAPVTENTARTTVDIPTINIIYQSQLDEQAHYWDARDLRNKEHSTRQYSVKPISPIYSVKPNEKKIVKYIRLCRGQKLDVNIRWYNKTLSNLSISRGNLSPSPKKEMQVEQDGYYLIELIAPPSTSVNLYTFFMHLTPYENPRSLSYTAQ